MSDPRKQTIGEGWTEADVRAELSPIVRTEEDVRELQRALPEGRAVDPKVWGSPSPPRRMRRIIGLKYEGLTVAALQVATIRHKFARSGQVRRLKVAKEDTPFFVVRAVRCGDPRGLPLVEPPGLAASELTSDLNRGPPAIDWPAYQAGEVFSVQVENVDFACHPFRAMLEVEEDA